MDIHLKRGNANKIMNRLLNVALNFNLNITEINGGSLRNAIPRESFSKIVVNSYDFLDKLDKAVAEIKNEYSISEPDLSIEVNKIDRPKIDFHLVILKKLLM